MRKNKKNFEKNKKRLAYNKKKCYICISKNDNRSFDKKTKFKNLTKGLKMKNAESTIANEVSLTSIFNDYKNGELELSQLEELAMLDEYGEDNDRTEYVNKFNEWVNTGLENWFENISDEELADYEIGDEDINSIVNLDDSNYPVTFKLRREQAKKLLEKALQNEKNNRN